MRKFSERVVTSNGKLKYVIALDEIQENNSRNATYISIKDGKIYYDTNSYYDRVEFNTSDSVHLFAKETFATQLQSCVREKINELKILEEILRELDISEVLGLKMYNRDLAELKALDYKHTSIEVLV